MAWAPDYITDEQLKGYEHLDVDDELDDVQIGWAITTASRAVDNDCSDGFDRQFGKVAAPEARLYTPRWSPSRCRWVVKVDDFMSVVGMAVMLDSDGDGVYETAVTGVMVKLPLRAAARGMPWTDLVLPAGLDLCGSEGEVQVTLPWGWTAVPVAVEQATALQASRFLARRNAPFGVAGSPETGSEVRLLARLDPDVKVSLRHYIRRNLAVG